MQVEYNLAKAHFFYFTPFPTSFRLKKKLVFIWQNQKDCRTFAPAFQMREGKFESLGKGFAPKQT